MPIGSIRKAAPVIYPFQLWVRSCSLKTSVSTLCVNTFQTTLASICCPLSLSLPLCLPLCLSLSFFAFVHVYLYCLVYLLPFLTWPWRLFLSFLAHRLCALCHILFIFCQFCVTFRATLPILYTYIPSLKLTQLPLLFLWVYGQPVLTVNVITHKFWQLLWAIVESFFPLLFPLFLSLSSCISWATE